ncbi:MAG: DNA topoisomerase IB [Candidatus Eremiobacteraeota bacterium]|nr:DNA topoisomerase IB [Candidatus Eremiobacteraeota bacterium]
MNAPSEEIEHARAAGLRYVNDTTPGFRRKRTRGGFTYYDAAGRRITAADEIARIKALAIPPAYEDVWICPLAHGHVQATARDARGRKQYRYHKRWREVRDANKYESTVAFAKALPAIRERVAADMAGSEMTRDKVLATVVKLLEETLIRIGNETYARDNDSYGLTTLRARHVKVEGEKRIRLKFRGKSGVEHAITGEDRRLAKTIKRCRDLPGEMLFSYIDDAGEAQPVRSEDVNEYLREISGGDFSAKDFRTWAATVGCALELERAGPAGTVAEAKQNLKSACTATAKKLGNTPTVCRNSYVHPAVVETYLDTRVLTLPKVRAGVAGTGLDDDERRVLRFLEEDARGDRHSERVAMLEKSVQAARRKNRERKPVAR